MNQSFTPTPSELRRDPASGAWVIIAPARGRRPESFGDEEAAEKRAALCPFCPGNEHETPPEIDRIEAPGGGWRVRVVPNMFPVLGSNERLSANEGPASFEVIAGRGSHEVIIESPDHDADLSTVGQSQLLNVLTMYRSRYQTLRDRSSALVSIFRNHGPAAGTSLSHPHSQIVGLPVVPDDVRHCTLRGREHFERTGMTLALDVLDREQRDGRRILMETRSFVVFAPFASGYPYEIRIQPRVGRPSIGQISDEELADLVVPLQSTLRAYRAELGDPAYNLLVQNAPVAEEDRPYACWGIRIVPRLTIQAGLELGTGVLVNPVSPEDAAVRLRNRIRSRGA